ncbi:hypothetical protein QCA50_011754 [Cerrena zonata]|uniref:F-box domain-containing protein n=1 Tax=Cerrena zonata TaxID=2478898 RepID=A0AAW0G1C6_9APHY
MSANVSPFRDQIIGGGCGEGHVTVSGCLTAASRRISISRRALLPPTLPRLPIELCESIMDWIAAECDPFLQNMWTRVTLLACSLVCRTWRYRAQLHLFTCVNVKAESLSTFNRSLKAPRHLASFINELNIDSQSEHAMPVSSLFIAHKSQNLKTLHIFCFDLTREHPWLCRAPLRCSVQVLDLEMLKKCNASQLIRFLNAFHSLSSLHVFLDFKTLEHNGQILPSPYYASSRSLTVLDLELIPGVFRLLDWFIKAGLLLGHLKMLMLACIAHQSQTEFQSCFGGVEALLRHCGATIEDLTLIFNDVPMMGEVSDLFCLEHFVKMHKLTYRGDAMLKYAARQLSAVSSKSNLVEVQLDIRLLKEWSPVADLCKTIDSALVSAKYPMVRRVNVCREILFDYFSNLQKRGIIETYWRYN